jgi:hypothetical protein
VPSTKFMNEMNLFDINKQNNKTNKEFEKVLYDEDKLK